MSTTFLQQIISGKLLLVVIVEIQQNVILVLNSNLN